MHPNVENWPSVSAEDGHWLAGLVDGEGCFVVHIKGKNILIRLLIEMRADDKGVLREAARIVGCGTFHERPRRNTNWAPEITWQVGNKKGVKRIIEIFSDYPLRSKKKRDFDLWKEAAELHSSFIPGGREARERNKTKRERITEIQNELKNIRVYAS